MPFFATSMFPVKPLVGAVCAALCLGLALPVAAANGSASASATPMPPPSSVDSNTDRVRYTIVLKDEPLAAYRGGVAGLAKAPRVANGRRAGRLDLHAPAARAYVDYLAQRQSALVGELTATIGRPLDVVGTMQHALNAVIVELDAREAGIVAARPDVDFVEREHELQLLTDRGPAFIGAPSIWDGSASNGVASLGEGVIVGVLDTGINWESPAFAAVGPLDGYVHVNPYGSGTYVGQCGPTPPNADLGRCNDKLIGMYDFTTTSSTRSATDLGGHGSHTASTVAGNTWIAPFGSGTFTISGVAPHANVIAYRVCTTGCSSSASSQSVESAIINDVDVINYSISGGTSPWGDSVSIAFRNAVGAGVFIAASAGNDGPVAGSVNHVEPWVETVAASTKNNVVGFAFNLTAPTAPQETQNLPLRPAAPPLPTASLIDVPVVRSPNFADGSNDGCAPYPADTFTVPPATPGGPRVGAVAALTLDQNASNCGSGARRTAALAAGAVGVIFVDRDFINLGASGTSWSMLRADWDKVWQQIQIDPEKATASLMLPAASFPQRGDVVADFSARGPRATGGQFLVKPNITAPGVDILAAYAAVFGGATSTAISNGTSMSGPHIAGSAALLRAVRPEWTPTEIRSAMNMTAKLDGLIRADGSPVDAWDLGSGRVDLTRAALSGLVLDETTANFVASNPSSGGVLANLNLAEFTSANCATTCTFTRTVRSTSVDAQAFVLSASGSLATAVTVSPAEFTIAGGDTQVIEVTIDGTQLASGWNFGQLVLQAQAQDVPPDEDMVFADGFDGTKPEPPAVLSPTLHLPITIRR